MTVESTGSLLTRLSLEWLQLKLPCKRLLTICLVGGSSMSMLTGVAPKLSWPGLGWQRLVLSLLSFVRVGLHCFDNFTVYRLTLGRASQIWQFHFDSLQFGFGLHWFDNFTVYSLTLGFTVLTISLWQFAVWLWGSLFWQFYSLQFGFGLHCFDNFTLTVCSLALGFTPVLYYCTMFWQFLVWQFVVWLWALLFGQFCSWLLVFELCFWAHVWALSLHYWLCTSSYRFWFSSALRTICARIVLFLFGYARNLRTHRIVFFGFARNLRVHRIVFFGFAHNLRAHRIVFSALSAICACIVLFSWALRTMCVSYWLTRLCFLTSGCLVHPVVLTTLVLGNCPRGNWLVSFSFFTTTMTTTTEQQHHQCQQYQQYRQQQQKTDRQYGQHGTDTGWRVWGKQHMRRAGMHGLWRRDISDQKGGLKPVVVTAPPKIGDRRETGVWEAFRQMSDRNITRLAVTTTRAVEYRWSGRRGLPSGVGQSHHNNMSNDRLISWSVLGTFPKTINMNTRCLVFILLYKYRSV